MIDVYLRLPMFFLRMNAHEYDHFAYKHIVHKQCQVSKKNSEIKNENNRFSLHTELRIGL